MTQVPEIVNKLKLFNSGATRSMDVEEFRFDLAPACATRREAKIWAEGAKIHGENNWKKGFPPHICINHLEYHLNKYKDGDRTEDHLAKIVVNTEMAMFFEEISSDSTFVSAERGLTKDLLIGKLEGGAEK